MFRNVLKYAFACVFIYAMSWIVAYSGASLYYSWKNSYEQRPVVVQNELVEHPSTVEENLAQLLGWHMLKLSEARRHIKLSERELGRFDVRVKQLEEYIIENKLPIPAEDPITINLIPFKITE